MHGAVLPLSSRWRYLNNRNTEEARMQSGRVDEHLDNAYKALQKLCEGFLLQLLTFLAARFCYILVRRQSAVCKVEHVSYCFIKSHVTVLM